MWGQPPSAVRRAQPGLGGGLKAGLVSHRGFAWTFKTSGASLRGQPKTAVPTFFPGAGASEFSRKVPVYQRSVAVTTLGLWHGSVVRM